MLKSEEQAFPPLGNNKSIIDTAQFRKLVQLDIEPAVKTHGAGENHSQQEQYDYSDDLLAVTDKFETLVVPESDWFDEFEVNPGVDPYNSGDTT